MRKKAILAGILAAGLAITVVPGAAVSHAEGTAEEVVLEKSPTGNPLGGVVDGKLVYGGDPAVL